MTALRSSMTSRALIAGTACSVGFASTALAQLPRPTREKILRMINRAFANPETVGWTNPQIVGFRGAFRARSLGFTQGSIQYHFHVADPRQADDLIFFTNDPATSFFKMHRTGVHLRRVASALNHSKQTGGLKVWAGPECEADFAAQLAYWARKGI